MIDPTQAKFAVSASQGVLKVSNPTLIIDGHWGHFTESAFQRSSPTVKEAAGNVARSFGPDYTPAALVLYFAQTKSAVTKLLGANWITEDRMVALIQRAITFCDADKAGVTVGTMMQFVKLEARHKVGLDGKYVFDAGYANAGGYSGLFQFDKYGKAWKAASTVSPAIGKEMGSFSNVFNPWCNTLAAVAYALKNISTAGQTTKDYKGYRGPIDGAFLYGMHQQGAVGFVGILRGQRSFAGDQSSESVKFALSTVAKSYV